MVTGHTWPPHWLCGRKPPGWEVNQSKQPRAGLPERRRVSRKRLEERRQAPAFTRRAPAQWACLLALGPPHCFTWRETLGSLAPSPPLQACTLSEGMGCFSPSDQHFPAWFQSECVRSSRERKRRFKQERRRPGRESRRRLAKQALVVASWRVAHLKENGLPGSSMGFCGTSVPPDLNDPERDGDKDSLGSRAYKAFF